MGSMCASCTQSSRQRRILKVYCLDYDSNIFILRYTFLYVIYVYWVLNVFDRNLRFKGIDYPMFES